MNSIAELLEELAAAKGKLDDVKAQLSAERKALSALIAELAAPAEGLTVEEISKKRKEKDRRKRWRTNLNKAQKSVEALLESINKEAIQIGKGKQVTELSAFCRMS